MDELKIMNLLAADRGISLTSEERAAMDRAAAEYFGRLPQSAIDSMGVTEADVQHIYEDYGLAEKLAGQLTDNVALEVSDSEAKVIHVSQIKTSDESEADAFQRAASQEDADFQSCAEEAGLTVSDRVLGRGDESDAYEKEAFSLAEGAVSQVIHADDAYYVLKCTDDYDEDETAARKERIYEERKKTRLSGDLRPVQQYDLRFLQQRALGQSGSDLGVREKLTRISLRFTRNMRSNR